MDPRVAIALLLLLLSPSATAETVVIEAGRDATLIEDPDGSLANGSGPLLFIGRTGQSQNGIRRGLLYFDVAAALPDDAIIESIALTLYMTPSHDEVSEIRLQRLQADWSEGPSSASTGGGAGSEPGDVTWLHRSYDDQFWVREGGQFIGGASARLLVGTPGFYTWPSNRNLVQDVRLWRANPSRNFGWIVIGDEVTPQSVKTFASREEAMAILRPALTVTYRMPGTLSGREPSSVRPMESATGNRSPKR